MEDRFVDFLNKTLKSVDYAARQHGKTFRKRIKLNPNIFTETIENEEDKVISISIVDARRIIMVLEQTKALSHIENSLSDNIFKVLIEKYQIGFHNNFFDKQTHDEKIVDNFKETRDRLQCTALVRVDKRSPLQLVLTAYGRERAKICAGGFDGCYGVVFKTNEFNEPFCKSCWEEYLSSENVDN